MKTYVKGPTQDIDKTKSLLEDFRDTFDNISDTLSEDAKEEKKARIVKKEMGKDRKSFTKYLPLYEMITQTGEYGPDGNKSVNIPKRNKKIMGGLLEDERVGYADGPNEEEVERMDIRSHLSKPELLGPERTSHLENAPKDSPEFKKSRDYAVVELNMSPDALEVEINKLRNEERNQKLTGGQATIAKTAPPFNEITSDDFTELRKQKQDGGNIDGQMSMLMMTKKPEEDMLPDDEMEDEYLDFILDEALDSEEEDYLMSQLQGNERLSEIFDKVIDIAQEFAGSGPVEGPGSGVSDSIPARLSDGEFVFTAKAVEEIGADNLMAMMKDAEMKADDRQGLANGGEPEERVELPVEEQKEPQVRIVKETVDSSKGLEDEDEISKGIKSKMMLDPDQRHVRS